MAALEAPKGGGGIVKCWRNEAGAAKEKWSDQVKVTQAKKDLDTFPFPMSVSRAIPRPDNFTAKAWEVWELKPKLILSSKPSSPEDELDLKCEVATDGDLPTEAADAMGAAVVKAWRKKIKKAAKASTKAAEANAPPFNFCLVDMFGWAEDNYVEILSTLPTYVNRFISEASTGGNEWRYCILEPKIPPPQVAPLTEEEEAAAEAAEIARMMKDLEMAQQAAIAREELAAERRELHDLEGPKVRQLSKKEKEDTAAAKRGQGSRTAKTGSRASKADPTAKTDDARKRAEKEKKKAKESKA